MVNDFSHMVCVDRCVVYGTKCVVYGVKYAVWVAGGLCMVSGIWFMVPDIWYMHCGARSMVCNGWFRHCLLMIMGTRGITLIGCMVTEVVGVHSRSGNDAVDQQVVWRCGSLVT